MAARDVMSLALFSRNETIQAYACQMIFGGVAYALGCVPLLSWLLEFSSSVGAALTHPGLMTIDGRTYDILYGVGRLEGCHTHWAVCQF